MESAHRRLTGRHVIVTGASSGIGKGIALALGEAGANVIVNYHSHREEAEEVVKTLHQYGVKAYAVQADISKENEVIALCATARQHLGHWDVLVNNSGIQADAPIDEMTLDQWNQVIQTNLTGAFLCAREAIKEFKGHEKKPNYARGHIVFISSVHQQIPWAKHSNYAASKGGVKLFMESLAQEVAHEKIRVNSIAPGAIRTPINRHSWETTAAMKKLLKIIPYQRIGEPEDIAKATVWLISDESDYVNGTTLFVDGGMTLYPPSDD